MGRVFYNLEPNKNCLISWWKCTSSIYNIGLKEVEQLKSLKYIKVMGVDLVPTFIFKDCACVFVKPLLYINNLILKTCKFPSIWKQARVFPVFKKSDPSLIVNYRPISISCNPSISLLHTLLTIKVRWMLYTPINIESIRLCW